LKAPASTRVSGTAGELPYRLGAPSKSFRDEGSEQFFPPAEQLEWMSSVAPARDGASNARQRRRLVRQSDAVESWAAENHLGFDDEFNYHREGTTSCWRLYIARERYGG